MGRLTKRLDVDAGWLFIGGVEALPEPMWNRVLPALEEAKEDAVAVYVNRADALRVIALRTRPGASLSGTHPIRIVRDKAGRAVQAVIDLISDEET